MNATEIDQITREACPVDFRMLRSYVRLARDPEYARRIQIPSLRRQHPEIWQTVASKFYGDYK
jgi:hypothetical protein